MLISDKFGMAKPTKISVQNSSKAEMKLIFVTIVQKVAAFGSSNFYFQFYLTPFSPCLRGKIKNAKFGSYAKILIILLCVLSKGVLWTARKKQLPSQLKPKEGIATCLYYSNKKCFIKSLFLSKSKHFKFF